MPRLKRTSANVAGKAGEILPQPCRIAKLTVVELEDIKTAYLKGATNEILIGMMGSRRLLTSGLPSQHTLADRIRLVSQESQRLRRYGCDGWIYVRRVRLKSPTQERIAILIDQAVAGEPRIQMLALVDASSKWKEITTDFLEDAASKALKEAFTRQ